jgi:hypothetical protein
MVAATTPLVTGHNAFANKAKVKFGDKVRVGDIKLITIQAADNSQHCAFGSGSSLDTCTNAPINTQSQTRNAGSTGSG